MRTILRRARAIAFLPLLPVAMAIDLALGDIITGVPVTAKQKLTEHIQKWIAWWQG